MLDSFYKDGIIEAGCDEAGRGCLAGPVFAAAVILPPDYRHPILNDSKQLNPKVRESLRREIETIAIAWAIGSTSVEEIDKINILNASILAMHRAITKLTVVPEHLIIDGNKFKAYLDIPHTCIVKGDSQFYSIAAASVLAKTYRDDYMTILDRDFPLYNWSSNKGYPTKAHRIKLMKHGPTIHHRMSFRLTDGQMKIVFEENSKRL